MQGFISTLLGRTEKINRKKRRQFYDAIPDSYPAGTTLEERLATHPAYGSNSAEAMGYRRANSCHGPLSKVEHGLPLSRQEHEEEVTAAAGWVERILSRA